MKILYIVFSVIIIPLLMVSCTSTTALPNSLPNNIPTSIPPTEVPNPDSRKASVTGKMIDANTNQPLVEMLVRLAPVYGEGKEAIYIINDATNPGAYTDTDGFFVFTDIDPGPYAVLFTDINGNYLAINETPEKILTVDATNGKVNQLGIIRVEIPKSPSSSK